MVPMSITCQILHLMAPKQTPAVPRMGPGLLLPTCMSPSPFYYTGEGRNAPNADHDSPMPAGTPSEGSVQTAAERRRGA